MPSNKKKCRVISYPKSGRTWLRAIFRILNIDISLGHGQSIFEGIPYKKIHKPKYDYKVIFLIRDPRDVAVSSYFQLTKRMGRKVGTMSEMLRNKCYGMDKILTFHQAWKLFSENNEDVLIVKYEDLHSDLENQIRRILEFSGRNASEEKIKQAIEHTKFENLQLLERTQGERYAVTGVKGGRRFTDPEALKFRRGKIGDYKEYLTKEDINYCNQKMLEYEGFYK